MSAALIDALSPCACSGGIYAGVPMIAPACVSSPTLDRLVRDLVARLGIGWAARLGRFGRGFLALNVGRLVTDPDPDS